MPRRAKFEGSLACDAAGGSGGRFPGGGSSDMLEQVIPIQPYPTDCTTGPVGRREVVAPETEAGAGAGVGAHGADGAESLPQIPVVRVQAVGWPSRLTA